MSLDYGVLRTTFSPQSFDPFVFSTLQEPKILINETALDAWKHNQLANAEELLTEAIHDSQNTSYHALASRALVRAYSQKWGEAITDAKEVFTSQVSLLLKLMLPLNPVHRHSAIHHRPHCKEHSAGRERRKVQGVSGVRHRIRVLSFDSR